MGKTVVVIGSSDVVKGKEFKPTNFANITASPEKLAEFISKITCECWDCKRVYTASCPHYNSGMTCFCSKETALEWLEQEAAE